MNGEQSELGDGFRESAIYLLIGATIFGSDTTYLSSSLRGDGELGQGSNWPFWVMCAVWAAIYAFLGLCS